MSSSQQMPLLPCDKYGYCPGFCKKGHSLSCVVEPLSVQNPPSKQVHNLTQIFLNTYSLCRVERWANVLTSIWESSFWARFLRGAIKKKYKMEIHVTSRNIMTKQKQASRSSLCNKIIQQAVMLPENHENTTTQLRNSQLSKK